MASFGARIRPYVTRELERASEAEQNGDCSLAFEHLEKAHVLGQASTREHVRVDWKMLCWSARQRQPREVAGQLLRMIAASTMTASGLIPRGNTGGSNVGAFTNQSIPEDLQRMIDAASETDDPPSDSG